jgi:hypothetical protein
MVVFGVAWAGPVVADPVAAQAAVRAACPAGLALVPGQSFTFTEPGKAWDGALVAVAFDAHTLCVAHRAAGQPVAAVVRPFPLCMNCSLDDVSAVGFADVNGDGAPDVSVALAATDGWNPQSETERFHQGTVFAVWTRSADGATWTWREGADRVTATTLKELWAALKAAP